MSMVKKNKKVHLVLGSGGARGIAHIGVIDVLEEQGYEIRSIAGCSMGSVVGGIYAAGFHSQYRDWVLTLTKKMLFRIMDFTLARQGFLKGDRIFSILKEVTGDHLIEDLRIPFIVVAADMVTNQEVHYSSGDLYRALRASIAIPAVFTPVLDNGQFLVDGGVLNPLPLNLVKKDADELVVAVNVNGRKNIQHSGKEEEDSVSVSAVWKWLNPLMQINKEKQKYILPSAEYSIRELLLVSYEMTQDRLTSMMLEKFPPDILIEIPRSTCSTFEFYKAKEVMEIGRQSAESALNFFNKSTSFFEEQTSFNS